MALFGGTNRSGFTLFELILAVALSATLLALIGTAINLYLMRVDASRTRVEEAQLARSVLAMIADDLRATFAYQPQDTSGVAELAASAASYDVDAIDAENAAGSAGAAGTASSASSVSSSSDSSGMSATSSGEPEGVLQLGVNGALEELIVDVDRLPRLDQALATANMSGVAATSATGQTSQLPQICDVKTIRYFVRRGEEVRPGSVAATSLSPEGQARAGGLVRQELNRAMRTWAEQSGREAMLQTSGVALVAPEVVRVEFRYFNGSEVADYWDMEEMGSLPLAIEVQIWIAPAAAAEAQSALAYGLSNVAEADQYRQTVYLPLSGISAGSAGSATSASDASSATDSSGDDSTSAFGSSGSGDTEL